MLSRLVSQAVYEYSYIRNVMDMYTGTIISIYVYPYIYMYIYIYIYIYLYFYLFISILIICLFFVLWKTLFNLIHPRRDEL